MTGRKRVDQEREDARVARGKARRAVSLWREGRFGPEAEILQQVILVRLGKELSGVVKRYPAAIRIVGKKNLWNMVVLESILWFDDPVTMLGLLQGDSPSAQLEMIEKIEKEGCSHAQEETLRRAMLNRPIANVDAESDPEVIALRWYKENNLKRKI